MSEKLPRMKRRSGLAILVSIAFFAAVTFPVPVLAYETPTPQPQRTSAEHDWSEMQGVTTPERSGLTPLGLGAVAIVVAVGWTLAPNTKNCIFHTENFGLDCLTILGLARSASEFLGGRISCH